MSLAIPRYATAQSDRRSSSPDARPETDDDGGSVVCCKECHNCPPDSDVLPYSGSGEFSFSSDPVRYSNGEVKFIGNDLESTGFGMPWEHKRSYSNQLTNQVGGINGNGWRSSDCPYLVETASGAATVCVFIGTIYDVVWFDLVAGSYAPRFGVSARLTHDTANQQYVFNDARGYTTKFFDCSSGIAPALQGQFYSFTDLSGNETVASYDPVTNLLTSFIRQAGNISAGFVYAYFTDGDNIGQLQTVTLMVTGQAVKRANYTYYGANEPFGNLNDLKLVALQILAQSVWSQVQLTYYRYYKPGEVRGFPYGMRYQLGQQSYTLMQQAGINPEAATNAEVSKYADNAFHYDPNTQAAIWEKTSGGNRVFKFTYTNSSFAPGFNIWAVKTIETLPDGNQNVVYTNYAGQVMLAIRKAGQQQWFRCNQYDNYGLIIAVAHSSVVLGYDETQPGLVILNPNAGLIDRYVYYPSTNIAEGAVAGLMQYRQVQQGALGIPILIHQYLYTEQDALGTTIYPLWKDICYPNAADPLVQILCTIYSYTWQGETLQVAQKTITLPVVPTSQNGSGMADSRIDAFDPYGNLTWAMDERGIITNRSFDIATGAVTELIKDLDTSIVSGAPAGWQTPPGAGLNLVFDYTVDGLGRVTQELGPLHGVDLSGTNTTLRRAKWTLYQDAIFQVWQGSGYAVPGTCGYACTLINPVKLTFQDLSERDTDEIQAVRTNTNGPLLPTDAFPESIWISWTNRAYAWNLNPAYERVYFKLPVSGTGIQGTNFYQTNYRYDQMQRLVRQRSADGTIQRTVYNPMSWPIGNWTGTNDNGATNSDPIGGGVADNNMVQIAASQYDNGLAGGDGNLTQQIKFANAQTARITNYGYDFRDRQTIVDGEIDFFQVKTYDNLDRLIQVDQYDTTATGNLVARTATNYDSRGRIYQTLRFGVNPATGQVGPVLMDNTWFDPSDNAIQTNKAGSHLLQRTVFDGVNRVIAQYQTTNSATAYPYPVDVSSDTVYQQDEKTYDGASNVIQQLTRERFDNATGTGALTSPTGPQPQARVTYMATWPDPLGRRQSLANYGTNQGFALVRPNTAPSSSGTVQVTTTAYNDAGLTYQMTDPNGIVRFFAFDAASRVIQDIKNYVTGGTGPDQNQETDYTYTAINQIATLTAKNNVTGAQVTQNIYGTSLANSDIASNKLLRTVIYPDDSPMSPDRVVMVYNAQGQIKSKQDQMGTVRALGYDLLGRQISDEVTALGTGVDGAVMQIARTYEVRGMVQTTTSYDSATDGNVVNDVLMAYNSFSQLVAQYQAHGGAASISSPVVQNSYADGSANTIRPISLIYPSGRVLNHDYGTSGGPNDLLSRIGSLIDNDGITHLADYLYVGLNRVAQVSSPEPGTMLTYIQQGPNNPPVGSGGDQYTGWDQFGRIVDQRWSNATGTDLERCQFGFNHLNNRLWRKNVVAQTGQDEFYTYDGLSQLTDFQRGTLDANNTGLVGTPAWEEDLSYDPTGNWQNYATQVNGQMTLNQPRTQNAVNEILTISDSASLINQDAAGNINVAPQPSNWNSAYIMTYDAWNRLVQVMNGSQVVAVYAYDAKNWRISVTASGVPRDYYYTSKWQVVEEQVTAGVPDRQFIWGLLGGVDNLLLRDRPGFSERFYVFSDTASVTAIADATGTVQERYSYNSFGSPLFMAPSFSPLASSQYDWETLYASYRYDSESGYYQVRNRYLQPSLGRWLTRDPIGYKGGTNLYAYCLNNSTNTVDPQGLDCPGCDWISNPYVDLAIAALFGALFGVEGGLVGVDIYMLANSTCGKQCCAWHDQCYSQASPPCTAASWLNLVGDYLDWWLTIEPCDTCNYDVLSCFAACGGTPDAAPPTNYYCQSLHDFILISPDAPDSRHCYFHSKAAADCFCCAPALGYATKTCK